MNLTLASAAAIRGRHAEYAWIDSPFGRALMAVSAGELCWLNFPKAGNTGLTELEAWWRGGILAESGAVKDYADTVFGNSVSLLSAGKAQEYLSKELMKLPSPSRERATRGSAAGEGDFIPALQTPSPAHPFRMGDLSREGEVKKAVNSNGKHHTLSLFLPGTPFRHSVWQALAAIPHGETLSYGQLAARIGRPKAARAVGGAVGSNPIAWVLPCHRVLAGDGSLHGFGCGLPMKEKLLAAEGFRAAA